MRSVAERPIDADGLIVAPGFIDGHTHMDAQVAWDRLGSCSCWYGVTTVVNGEVTRAEGGQGVGRLDPAGQN